MKKSIILLIALGLVSADVSAHTNKTYMRPVDSSVYMPNRFNINGYLKKEKRNKDIDVKLDIQAYHFLSSRSNQVGKYFGVNEKNEFNLLGDKTNDAMDIDYRYFISVLDDDDKWAKIKLLPESQIAGANFAVILGLNRISEKLSFKFNLPYQRIHNNIRMNFNSSDHVATKNIKDYLMGNYSSAVAESSQEALKYAKITDQQEKMGIPFIDFSLAYNFCNKDDMVNTFKTSLIVPTHNSGNAEYLLEPVLGNADHFGINVGIEGYRRIYDEKRSSLDIVWDFNYKYLFDATEKRTLGIKGANWGQYYLLGKNGVTSALIPAANVLTQDLKVKPGSQLDLNLEALFGYHASRISIGGNILARQKENVRLKNAFPLQTYGVAEVTFSTAGAFDLDDLDTAENYSTYGLNENNIDLEAATTPASFLYKVYAQYAYDYEKSNSEKMFTIALGGSINIADENSAFSGYGLWLNSSFYF